ncbi:MAG: hypothetical protein A4E71_00126 [Smithella sp. PtaU1.Bin162]|nr:MAG: hypothetical protein A4E71_00126 [Smithella sp. PtaU1.Bin162]
MLIKYMDEVIQRGAYDIKESGSVNVYLSELKEFIEKPNSKGEKIPLAEWHITGEGLVPRTLLHYDDTSDGSNTLNGSWQKFFASKKSLGETIIYNGSSIFFKDGTPNFGGVAKAAIYMRYSEGFLNWVSMFDLVAAEKIRVQLPLFEKLIENDKTKKIKKEWNKFKPPQEDWALSVLCTLSDGKKIVLGLADIIDGDWDELKEMNVDIEHSIEFMKFLKAPKKEVAEKTKKNISEEFQMGSGLGRNAFGKTYKLDDISDSEYTRLMGALTLSERKPLLKANQLSYPVKVSPNPASKLLFLPEGDLKYKELEKFVDSENKKREIFLEDKKAKKKNKEKNEDQERIITERPDFIPIPASCATLFLSNIEKSGPKKKIIIQQVFPGISLRYLQCLNQEILNSGIQMSIVGYMKKALTCQDSDTPCVYNYWTKIFTSALQKNYVSANEVFYSLQRYGKAFSGEELISGRKAGEYFRVVGKIRRLQHLIYIAINTPQKLDDIGFEAELKSVEQYQLTIKGVFEIMATRPQTADLAGPVYELLWEKQKMKLDAFVTQAWQGVPGEEFSLFIKGALVGILLNELTYAVTTSGRSFSVTQGRHPSTLRGEQIISLVTKGIGLLMNLNEQKKFNCNTLPFINSCLEDSRKDTFNSGLIMGMVFHFKSNEKEA